MNKNKRSADAIGTKCCQYVCLYSAYHYCTLKVRWTEQPSDWCPPELIGSQTNKQTLVVILSVQRLDNLWTQTSLWCLRLNLWIIKHFCQLPRSEKLGLSHLLYLREICISNVWYTGGVFHFIINLIVGSALQESHTQVIIPS